MASLPPSLPPSAPRHAATHTHKTEEQLRRVTKTNPPPPPPPHSKLEPEYFRGSGIDNEREGERRGIPSLPFTAAKSKCRIMRGMGMGMGQCRRQSVRPSVAVRSDSEEFVFEGG